MTQVTNSFCEINFLSIKARESYQWVLPTW